MSRVRLASAGAMATALLGVWVAFALLVWIYGEAPLHVARLLWGGTWGTSYGIGQVLFKATPILFTGVAVDLALRAGLFNIGADGQLAVASVAAALVGARVSALPSALAIPVVVLAAMLAGAAWAAVPALLLVRRGVHEVITTIMMNRIGEATIGALFAGGLAVRATVRTPSVAKEALVPRLDEWIGPLHGSAASLAFPLAVIVAFVVAWGFARTRMGIEIAWIGHNARACAAAGIAVGRRTGLAMLLSGALAGSAATATVLGYKGYYEEGLGAGAGFAGIAVALLGRSNPVGIVLAALFFGTLEQGGLAINGLVPREVTAILLGVTIATVSLGEARVRRALQGIA